MDETPSYTGRSEASHQLWGRLSPGQVRTKTAGGLERRKKNILASDRRFIEQNSVELMAPNERWKCVANYEKRQAMRQSRASSSSLCPSADLVACKILELYAREPETRLSDRKYAASTSSREPLAPSGVRAEAAGLVKLPLGTSTAGQDQEAE